jgi:predicted nuclease of predicted toxin-antitoxin system
MRLLLDQNISFRVAKIISDRYPIVKQVRELGLENASDSEIWEYAKSNSFTIVTFDSDFYDLSVLEVVLQKSFGCALGTHLQKTLQKYYLTILS